MSAPEITLDLIIEDDRWECISDIHALCDRAFAAAAKSCAATGSIALMLADDETLRGLNRDFRGKDKPTDVLSFPAHEMDRPLIGDIAVAFETCAEDADAQDKSLENHLSHLLIHGYLHLCGHDHENDADAERMEALEINALASLGIPNPYFVT